MAYMIKTVFFDMYGTIAGFEPSRFKVQSEACAPHGIVLTHEGILEGYKAADAYMSRENAILPLGRRAGGARDEFFGEYERLVIQGSGVEVSLDRALEIWRVVQAIPHTLAPFDDVVPAMEQLRERGLTVGLITNMDGKGSDIVDDLGLSDQIYLAVTSGEAGAAKPSAAIFLAALARAGTEPDEAIHVGDQPSSDIEGALGVGMGAILLDRDCNHPGYTACPRIESLVDLAALVDEQG
ncbi:MAG: HAD family hydrolase [SAR202 cluster bacterium]|nr:HAD family hydrolase [SAR202 cluster bacterium]